MPENAPPKDSGYATPQDMRDWLHQEILDSAKAFELRVREATEFVDDYSRGRISPEQALDRHVQYGERWGEALYGATAGKTTTNEEIVAAIDRARKQQWSDSVAAQRKQSRSL